jgi:hypothetical protein
VRIGTLQMHIETMHVQFEKQVTQVWQVAVQLGVIGVVMLPPAAARSASGPKRCSVSRLSVSFRPLLFFMIAPSK